MEKLNKFLLEKAYLVIFLLVFGIMSLGSWVLIDSISDLGIKRSSTVAIVIGLLFSGLVTSSVHLVRKSGDFWEALHELELRVETAEYKEDIKFIYEGYFQEVLNKAMGQAHSQALKTVYAVMQTKYKLLPSKI
jgi:hypothetical protein